MENKDILLESVSKDVSAIYEKMGIRDSSNTARRIAYDIIRGAFNIMDEDTEHGINVLGVDEKTYRINPLNVIREVKLEILFSRLYDKETCIEDILLKSNKRFVVRDNKIYNQVPKDIGRYLMDNDFNSFLFEKIELNSHLLLWGNNVKFMKKYLSMEPSINKKKYIVQGTDRYDPEKDDYAFLYLRDKICQITPHILEDKYDSNKLIYDICINNDISYHDVLYRLYNGMDINSAIEIGKVEREKYNLHNLSERAEYNGRQYNSPIAFILTMIKLKSEGKLEDTSV